MWLPAVLCCNKGRWKKELRNKLRAAGRGDGRGRGEGEGLFLVQKRGMKLRDFAGKVRELQAGPLFTGDEKNRLQSQA